MKKNLLTISLWSIVILINAYFIYNFPFKHFNTKSWNQPFGPLLTGHIVFGMIALLIGPLQFFSSIRKKYPRFHRMTGRTYLISILVGAGCATILAINHNIIIQKRIVFGTGLLGLAAAWLLTSGMAFWAVKNRNFVQHREWMVKSYVVTCGFTFYRVFLLTAQSYIPLENIDYEKEFSGILAWSCWAVPLLVTEVILQAKKIKRSGNISLPVHHN
jgi:hypothetical protein